MAVSVFPFTTIDQLGQHLVLLAAPQRIVSLVPSQTELLFDLGLGKRVVGVTKFCIHPLEARQNAVIIGGTKQFDFAKIDALQPDLIIGNKEENYQEGIEKLAAKYPTWVSDIYHLTDALAMICQVSALTGGPESGATLAVEIAENFAQLVTRSSLIPAAYFIWRKPYMVAASGTFIDDMLRRAGFRNVFAHLGRYPEITAEQLSQAAPERILLSSEPYPFSEKHLAEFQQICPAANIQIVDGEMFSWYGSRLLKAATYFRQLQLAGN